MGLHKAYLGRLSIPNGQSASNILAARELGFASAIVFYNPATFTGTVAVQVAPNEGAVAGDMKALYNNGSAVNLTAGRVERQEVSGFEAIRVLSGSAEAAQRDIDVYAILDIT